MADFQQICPFVLKLFSANDSINYKKTCLCLGDMLKFSICFSFV